MSEHIEDLEAELAELDARLDRKTKRRHYEALATQRRSPDATVRAQDRVIAQLESELVRDYAELGEKVKRKRGKRDEPDEEAAITPAEPSIRPAIKEGLSILYWYVANPHKLELFVLSHSIPRRERAMQRAILAATYGPLALLAVGYLLAALLTLPTSPLPLITTAAAVYGLFRAAKHDFGRVVFCAQDKFGWSYFKAQIVGLLCVMALLFIHIAYPRGEYNESYVYFMAQIALPIATVLIGVAQSAMLTNMAKVLNLAKSKELNYQLRAFNLTFLHTMFLAAPVLYNAMRHIAAEQESLVVLHQLGAGLVLLGCTLLVVPNFLVGITLYLLFFGLSHPTSFGERLLPNPHPSTWKTLLKQIYWAMSTILLLAALLAYVFALLALFA
ncbi:hypothetical protein [Aggregatilinea lenta]|uniref:hypothetical protein n=1 Tax=Aggregatilinea lenta TaxID=913108 RepID=UPI000E5A3A49|nr:hypothetical protein [Aggregatilinea lenta]